MVDAARDSSEVRRKLREFLSHEILLDERELADNTPLLNGLVDSVGLMELVSFIEDEFAVPIDFGDVETANFRTIDDIARLVGQKLQGT